MKPCARQELEDRERVSLAPFAQFSGDTRGRVHAEDPPEWRTHFQRDRDRVIHSRAFRRLEYKTQVFLNGTGDHLRTRLTHTIEVAGISRNIARALRLNEDLTETIALAHDLGHSPFGHKGEEALNDLMKAHGGFEHNRQSLRVVEEIEQKYPGFLGLNLAWETREGLAKHEAPAGSTEPPLGFVAHCSSLEAQAANLADEIAYYSHDLDDGLDWGLLKEKHLMKHARIWHDAALTVKREHGALPDECRRYFIIRCLIDSQVQDVVFTTLEQIKDSRVKTADDVRRQKRPLVRYSPRRRELNLELRHYLYENLYYNPVVHKPNLRAVRMLKSLFEHYVENRAELGAFVRKRARRIGWHRAVCDYIAGMTDRYAIQDYERLFGPPIPARRRLRAD
ncbi:MAG: deoxyguanosinetriphosphate triphosphohydrolase [Verrucomicrobia bacterium]|nr:deoxyguanosinetriphosphate triphosphohydrolase [Verrucomicrobiota bacterium]